MVSLNKQVSVIKSQLPFGFEYLNSWLGKVLREQRAMAAYKCQKTCDGTWDHVLDFAFLLLPDQGRDVGVERVRFMQVGYGDLLI